MNGTHKVISINDPNTQSEESFTYDSNGNITFKEYYFPLTGSNGQAKYFWDESNRLRIASDAQNTMHHYIYDASGERVLKASSDYTVTYENGTLLTPGTVTFNSYTTYPSAFMVVNGDGVFSKHYYAGSQRIVSRLGDATATSFDCSTCATSKLANTNKSQAEDSKLQQAQIADLQLYMDKANKGKAAFADYKPQLLADQEKAIAEEAIAENTTAKTSATAKTAAIPTPVINPIYYYHPDHLGTSTFLTDANGNAYQFFLNLPYGETMAEQLGNNYYNTPYKFNGKELDEETGLYYYGARYYDPKTSIWLSVDPLAEKFPNMSPYAFCNNNPVNLVDPDGKEPVVWTFASWRNGLKPSQWYSYGFGRYDSKTFNSAAIYNTKNLNSGAYQSVYQRNKYYEWAQSQADAKGYNSKWFGAAQLVTGLNAVGGTAVPDKGLFTSTATDKFLQGGNKFLFSHNMKNAKDLLADGKLSGGFTDANGAKQSFEGLTGMALDNKMVEFEQSKVQEYISSYKGNDLNSIISNINKLMTNPVGPSEIGEVMDKSFNGGKSFNFKNYADRVKLGQELIKKAHDE